MEDKKTIEQQSELNALRWLALSFEALAEANAPQKLKQIPLQLENISGQVSQAGAKQQQVFNDVQIIKKKLDKNDSTIKLLENSGKVNELLSCEYYDKYIIQPMVRSLFPIFDIIANHREYQKDCNANKVIDSILSQLKQFLSNYNIESIEHCPGDDFDPKTSKSLVWEDTTEKHLDKKVAYSLRTGFKLDSQRILRMEMVSLYRYKPSQTNNNTIKEGE